jgi:hypothetical protein
VNKWKPLKNSSRGKTILEQLNPENHALYKKKLQVIDTYKTFVVDTGLPRQVILFAFYDSIFPEPLETSFIDFSCQNP